MVDGLTEQLGMTVPVVGAPMGGVAGGALAAAVSGAGALGCIGAGSTASADWIAEQAALAGAAGRPFGIGLLAWALDERPELLEATLAARPALVSVSYGRYQRWVPVLQAAGILVATQAGTVEEAREAERSGVDVVVARGGEGGGHGRAEVATLPLLQEVLEAVRVPVLAAGGIVTARGLAAVLAAGAAGGWVGTAFIACTEALTSRPARARLLAATSTSTRYGRVFDVGLRQPWPAEYGGRFLQNTFSDRWAGREAELVGDEQAVQQLRDATRSQDFDTAVLYAGQGVGLVREERGAAEVVAELGFARELLRAAAAQQAAPVAGSPQGAPVAESPEAAPVADSPEAAPVEVAQEGAPVGGTPQAAPVAVGTAPDAGRPERAG